MKQRKELGQHWLRDREILTSIAACAGEGEFALEIGPGLGTLTSALLKRFRRVVAVEYDGKLAEKLPKQFVGSGLTVVNEDILQFDTAGLPEGYVVVGNVPYYITAPIVQKFLQAKNRPSRMVFLVQKEVAERIAGVGGWSLLGLSVAAYADATLGPYVGREHFEPPPKVDSQVIIMEMLAENRLEGLDEERFWRLLRAGFKWPRKKLVNNLSGVGVTAETLREMGLNESVRAGELDLEAWKELYNKIKR
ncbi:16S rRNA (adenine(1518)-N(6)/adenine(1519)-N(6))-dimethyltransferase RsmA [Candidatus Saccharibacteria bacterium]|nr:16S rRNA (adenine(1518)-N(6)/adenine(1519)-N(6))-dimethyltransferase RsmA [Candidatus Saccharibacteria bacterium]